MISHRSVVLISLVLLIALVGTVSADTLIVYTSSSKLFFRDPNADFITIRNGVGTSSSYGTGTSFGRIVSTTNSNQYDRLDRVIFNFNTSVIGSGKTVSSTVLSIRSLGKDNYLGESKCGITWVSLENNASPAISDYNKFSSDYFSYLTYTNYPNAGSWANFTFNDLGVSNISIASWTTLMLRTGFDIENVSPTWSSESESGFYFVEKGYSYDPFLTIVYSSGGGGSAPVASFTCTKNFLRIPNSVTCTDSSTNTPTSWSWNLGDGSAAKTTQNVTYQYLKRGAWGITLNATNAIGSNVTPSATNMKVVGYENV